jgi:polyhydroxybutyrate depolymerase
MTRIRPLTAIVVLAVLGGCSGGPPPVDEPAPIPVATTVTDAQILTTGHEYTQCLRDNGIATFPEPIVDAGRLAWPERTTARDALEHNMPALTACAPILDPMPPSRLWPGWIPPRERPDPPAPSAGCDQPPPGAAGTSIRQEIVARPTNRTYLLHLPRRYDGAAGLPLVLAFHGATSQPAPTIMEDMERETGFSQLADDENFIVVYPHATTTAAGRTSWNTGSKDDPTVDDTAHVDDLLDHLLATLCVDPHRVYATGFSSGGGLTAILACRSDRIAAFAAVSGAFFVTPAGCTPASPVPLIEFHGTNDKVPYRGGPFGPDTLMPVPQWLQDWADRNRCSRGPTTFYTMLDVVAEHWTRCGGRSTVIHYRILNGQHAWPGADGATQTINATSLVWRFFRSQRLG